MLPHCDLSTALAPHLESLSTSSAALLTPLTAVLTTLVAELAALRAAHEQLVTQVSCIDAHLSTILPHSIPSPPKTPPLNSPAIDPELTQPPSPLPPDVKNEELPDSSASSHSQVDTLHQENLQIRPIKPERLKRRKRSSKRPCSGHHTHQVKQENFEKQPQSLSSQDHACKIEQGSSSNASPVHSPQAAHGTVNASEQPHTPKKSLGTQRKLLKECRNLLVLPTTPTTEVKSKKRQSSVFSYGPVVHGYANPAVAAKEVDNIVARRVAENCPPAFRQEHKPQPKTTCLQCQESRTALAAEAPDPDRALQRLQQLGCRHKEQVPRPVTPEGYWDLDFAETPTQPP